VVFALFTTLGIMNVIVGMICDGVLAKAREENAEKEKRLHEEKLTLLERVNDILKSMDHYSDGRVDAQELEQAMSSDPSVAQLIALAQLPEGFGAEELIMMLDNDGDGWLSYAEFLRSFYRLIDGGEFQRLCLMQANINAVKQMVVRVLHSTTGLNDRFQALEDRLVTHSGQGNCLEMRALAATNEPEQPMDLRTCASSSSGRPRAPSRRPRRRGARWRSPWPCDAKPTTTAPDDDLGGGGYGKCMLQRPPPERSGCSGCSRQTAQRGSPKGAWIACLSLSCARARGSGQTA